MMKEIPAEIRNHLQRITLILDRLESGKPIPAQMLTATIQDLKKLEKILNSLPKEVNP